MNRAINQDKADAEMDTLKTDMKVAPIKLRFKALFIDYLCIVAYLALLMGVAMACYKLFFGEVPQFTALQSQLVAFFTSVLPVMGWFAFMESKGDFASLGKRKVGIQVKYERFGKNPLVSSILRNALKFLPWQLAHMAVIEGVYDGFESRSLLIVTLVLPVIYVAMAVIRKDHRHFADIVSGSYVVMRG